MANMYCDDCNKQIDLDVDVDHVAETHPQPNPPKTSSTDNLDDELRIILHELWSTDGDWQPAINKITELFRTHQTKLIQQLIDEAEELHVVTGGDLMRNPIYRKAKFVDVTKLKELLGETDE